MKGRNVLIFLSLITASVASEDSVIHLGKHIEAYRDTIFSTNTVVTTCSSAQELLGDKFKAVAYLTNGNIILCPKYCSPADTLGCNDLRGLLDDAVDILPSGSSWVQMILVNENIKTSDWLQEKIMVLKIPTFALSHARGCLFWKIINSGDDNL